MSFALQISIYSNVPLPYSFPARLFALIILMSLSSAYFGNLSAFFLFLILFLILFLFLFVFLFVFVFSFSFLRCNSHSLSLALSHSLFPPPSLTSGSRAAFSRHSKDITSSLRNWVTCVRACVRVCVCACVCECKFVANGCAYVNLYEWACFTYSHSIYDFYIVKYIAKLKYHHFLNTHSSLSCSLASSLVKYCMLIEFMQSLFLSSSPPLSHPNSLSLSHTHSLFLSNTPYNSIKYFLFQFPHQFPRETL